MFLAQSVWVCNCWSRLINHYNQWTQCFARNWHSSTQSARYWQRQANTRNASKSWRRSFRSRRNSTAWNTLNLRNPLKNSVNTSIWQPWSNSKKKDLNQVWTIWKKLSLWQEIHFNSNRQPSITWLATIAEQEKFEQHWHTSYKPCNCN